MTYVYLSEYFLTLQIWEMLEVSHPITSMYAISKQAPPRDLWISHARSGFRCPINQTRVTIGTRGAAERVLPLDIVTDASNAQDRAGASTSVLFCIIAPGVASLWECKDKTGCETARRASVTLGVPYQLVILSEGWLVGWFPCCRGGRLSILWRSTPHPKVYVLRGTYTRGALPPPSPRAPRPRTRLFIRFRRVLSPRALARPKGRLENGRFAWAALQNLICCKLNRREAFYRNFAEKINTSMASEKFWSRDAECE